MYVYPHGARRVSRIQQGRHGARFPLIGLSGQGGDQQSGLGAGTRSAPRPRPASLPSLGGIGGRDCDIERKDKIWSGLREGEAVRAWEVGPSYKNRAGPPAVLRWQPAPGLSYRARPARARRTSCRALLGPGQNRAFGQTFGLRAFWTSIGLLGLAWVTDGWRSMLSGRWDEDVRLCEDRMDRSRSN
jgi:hypothetical protein